jgi:hypothetical protein
VSVTAAAPLIETSNASQGAALGEDALLNLPSPGRAAVLMAVTIPTVNPVGDPQFNRQQDRTNTSRISLGGGGIRANSYLLDGVPITNLPGLAAVVPTMETIDEVKIQLRTYDAEVGRTGGGVFNTSAKSGTNDLHGTAFYQTRPVWGQSQNYFNQVAGLSKEQTGLANAYFRLYGGAIGGPIFRNRTFFWFATEGYRTFTTRNLQVLWPSLKQRVGDFSTSTIGGQPVQLFNPWCRGSVANTRCPATGTGSLETGGRFTGAIIPRDHPAANPVGFNLAAQWPVETVTGDPLGSNENTNPNAITTAPLADKADMWTIKLEHRFSEMSSLSGLYVGNTTDEPGASSMPEAFGYFDPGYRIGQHRPHVVVLNNVNVLNDTTTLSLRYGWLTWLNGGTKVPFTAGLASLGFNPTYVNAVHPDGLDTAPQLTFDQVGTVGGVGGSFSRDKRPYAINGALSKLLGSHSIKIGADYYRIGVAQFDSESLMAGSFGFNRLFTGASGVSGSGHEVASLLLGLPTSGFAPANRGSLEWFTKYYGAYAQDDWRIGSNLTLNYGVRFEHEDGLREIENRQTVAFDREAINPIDALVPKAGTLLEGRTLTGGLVYAGVNGAPEEQGDPPAIKISPRVGVAWSLDDRTVVRGGYGLFYAAWQYAGEHGQIGYTRRTQLNQSSAERDVPLTTVDNPFPAGLLQPVGNSLGLLTGVGGNVNFIDQTKGAPKVHQYSIDIQRELPGDMALEVGYIGGTGRDLGFGGSSNTAININQIDPAVARATFPAGDGRWDAAALRQSIPNPFFGIPEAGEFGTRPTIQRGQLLRPFPQFGDLNMFERTEGGRRQYHGLSLKLDKRLGMDRWGFWGGRFSYVWSSTKDNQFGENSVFQARLATPQNYYDLDAEYGPANFDSPHRVILAPIVRIPGPSGDGLAYRLLGGWTASAIAEFVSGSPLNAVMSGGASDQNLGLFGGRQRPNLIGDPNTEGSDKDRVASADHTNARWFDRTAFENAGVGRYGTAPRTNGDARYQFRKKIDIVFAKNVPIQGSQAAEVRFEILNLTNTPWFAGPGESSILADTTTFGTISSQAGFMRIWQLTFRYRF